ncbi:ATP-binding cassette sub-family C member 4-like [Diorhabda sublineata]|uniref:ATP-binding cassette sub-family C member 4-like n=1 Tax=Diorhabda sublineata TaxID=1163346 RepID=UPI0024E0CECC|nr:ATP-binding cassette sub-family C member 4-like [Diorhabda sublineata]
MDSSKKYVKKSPEENANVFSKLFYWWFLPYFKFGYKNDVKIQDIYNASKPDLSGGLGDKLERFWQEEVKKTKNSEKRPSLKSAIVKAYLKSYSVSGVAMFFQFGFIRMVQPIVLAEYINYFERTKSESEEGIGWLWASLVILISFTNVVIMHSTSLNTQRIGMRVRISVCSLMYRKLLKLNHTSLGQTAAGQLINLLSNDVQRFDFASMFLHYIWLTPLVCVTSFYVMFRTVGVTAAIIGMAAIIIESIPLQGILSKFQGKLRYKIALKTDRRIKLMDEITSGIQVIKMYAWEKPFEKMVELSRKLEIDLISKTSYIQGILSAMAVFTERLTLYVTVITFVLMEQRISGNIVFSMAQLVNTIQLILAICFPRALWSYAEAKVSMKRIEDFLLLEENAEKHKITNGIIPSEKLGNIEFTDVTASWSPNPIVPTLIDMNLHIKPGTLCCIVGNVGSGKSSILQLLLKELPLTHGNMDVSGSIAYASQEPWLFVSSVKDNILFGKPFLKNRYDDVVRVCSLERDLKQFPYGENTLVGERGTSLSGGQRARVNLARAVYTEADIYLLDDPLSAVDTKVGRHLFDECIVKYLKGKTRILVTHQLQYMKKADMIVILNNGKIEKVGNFNELSEKELNILQQEPDEEKEKQKEVVLAKQESMISTVSINSVKKVSQYQSNTSLASSMVPEGAPPEIEEEVERGSVSTKLYLEYFRAGGSIILLFITLLMFFIAQMVTNASDLWLTYWTNSEAERYIDYDNVRNSKLLDNSTTLTTLLPILDSNSTLPMNSTTDFDQNYYIMIYTALIIGSIVLLTLRSFLYYYVCMTASKVLHNHMFHNVLQAPMRFFDTNPSGRILNRFSKDMGAIDELLPRAQIDAVQIFMVMAGILIMVFVVTPWMIIPTIILGFMFYYFREIYLATAQAVKRLEGVTRAPVFSHVSATLYGISTIRSSDAESMVIKEFDVLQDQHTSTWFLFIVSSTAFGFYLDVISTLFLILVTFQFLVFRNENTTGGNVGLVISQSLILTGMLQFGVRQTAEVASNMVSVERVLQYTKLTKEGPFESKKKPPREWPEKGKIIFKNTFLRYALELPPVLKNLNIEVNSAEKIGIVGRTGAGKSTLIASLFRLAPIEGTISIDEIDTAEIGLTDLRLNISIIPQEPVLFSASIRYNLDPFEKYSDEVLWEAIENVELKNAITDLNQAVSEGGSNFSAGQRQLICLARAIVRNNKILVMDEATANVDPNTDSLIQKTIRERFKDCTVLTIAHRLNTIMDSDRVLVMDAGEAMEFDHPYTLLQNPEGYFSKMVKETGPAMSKMLTSVAQEDYKKKYGSASLDTPTMESKDNR